MSSNSDQNTVPLEKPHSPLMELLSIAAPTIAQMASYTVMQFIDTWMLSRLNVEAPTAAGNAGLFAFTLICFGLGVISLVNTLVSQHYGARQPGHCGVYFWQGVWFGVFYSLLLLPLAVFAKPFFHLIGHEPSLQAMEAEYFRIVMLTAGVKLIGNSCAQFLLGVNHPTQVFLASLFGVIANAIAAWIMIFGTSFFPSMGLAGAAWAQNIGCIIEMLALVGFVLLPQTRRVYGVRQWQLRLGMFWKLMKIGLPAGIQFVGDLLVWTLFVNIFMGDFGTHAMSAATFTFRWMSLSFMPAIGLGTAVTCLVGRYIGRGQPQTAAARAHMGFALTAMYMVACGIAFFILRYRMMGVFADNAEILRIGGQFMIIAATWQFFDAMFIIYSGALRGAGDTLAPMVALISLNWGITLGGGWLIIHYLPKLGPLGPWYAAIVYGISLGGYCLLRFRAGKWKAIQLTTPVQA